MKDRRKKRICQSILGAALVAVTAGLAPVQAQPSQDREKPVISSYETRPAQESEKTSNVIPTYDKAPDSDGDAQDFEYTRYEEENDGNNGIGWWVLPREPEPTNTDE